MCGVKTKSIVYVEKRGLEPEFKASSKEGSVGKNENGGIEEVHALGEGHLVVLEEIHHNLKCYQG